MHESRVKPDIQELRSLSRLLTNSSFKKIVRSKDTEFFKRRIRKHAHLFPNYLEQTNASLLSRIFSALVEQYRNEYVYKSSLVNQVLLKEYNMSETTALFEFKISSSIADMLLINGKARLFEIKTELDSPERLESQITDYRKAVGNITVVTYESLADKYLDLIKGTGVGLTVLNTSYQLVEVKKAANDSRYLEHEVLFKMLHKTEYTNIILNYFGIVLDVPNTVYFTQCLALVKQIEINTFQRLAFEELKKRKLNEAELIESDLTPEELKTICIALNFNSSEINYLHRFLYRPFSR